MSAPLLEITNLYAGYNGVPVVRNLNLRVEPGEVVVLLGPNGAGKTTTLVATSAPTPIRRGDIAVFGPSMKGRHPYNVARDGLAHVLEERALFFQLTVRENLQLGSAKGSVDIARALEYFPALAEIQGRRAGLLSGGQQQMLAMAGLQNFLTADGRIIGLQSHATPKPIVDYEHEAIMIRHTERLHLPQVASLGAHRSDDGKVVLDVLLLRVLLIFSLAPAVGLSPDPCPDPGSMRRHRGRAVGRANSRRAWV